MNKQRQWRNSRTNKLNRRRLRWTGGQRRTIRRQCEWMENQSQRRMKSIWRSVRWKLTLRLKPKSKKCHLRNQKRLLRLPNQHQRGVMLMQRRHQRRLKILRNRNAILLTIVLPSASHTNLRRGSVNLVLLLLMTTTTRLRLPSHHLPRKNTTQEK